MHNHASSHCWLSVLEGDMQELQYRNPEGVVKRRNSFNMRAPEIPGGWVCTWSIFIYLWLLGLGS